MSRDESAAVRQHGGSANEAAGNPPHTHLTMPWPVALETFKRGKWCCVGKIVDLAGEPVLAIAVRHQRGTERVLSLPLPVLDYARACGCKWLVRRDDRQHTAGRILLADLRKAGWLGNDGEFYVKLSDLAPTPWQSWQYVENTVRLTDAMPQREERQAAALAQGSLL
jgi:hypothetical protein